MKYGELENVKGSVDGAASAGYLLNPKANNSFVAVNDLLNEGVDVYRLPDGLADKDAPAGLISFQQAQKRKLFLKKMLRTRS